MNSFTNSCLGTAALSVLLGLFVVANGGRKKLNVLWCLFCLSVGTWSAGLGLMVRSSTMPEALWWLRSVHYVGAIMIPIFFFHFVSIFADLDVRRHILAGYVLAAIQQVISLSGLLASVAPLPPFNFYTIPKPAYAIFTLYFFYYVAYSHWLLYKCHQSSANTHLRRQIKYIGVGTAVGFIGGSTAFLPVFHLPIFPYGVFGVAIYIITVSYAILHYRLLDLRLVLRDTALHTVTAALLGVACMLIGVPLVAVNAYAAVISSILVMALLMAFAYDPIRKALQPAIDRVIFANQFGYLEELAQLPNDMLEFTNLNEMLKFLMTRLKDAAKLENVRIFMYDPGHQSFVETLAKAEDGTSSTDDRRQLAEKDPLIKLLRSDSKLWTQEDFVSPAFKDAQEELKSLQGAACFPVNKEKELLGVVVLGKKRSGELFNQQDLKILRALRVRLENFLGQAMVITQEALNMVKDSHDMKNDVNALKGRITWRAMRIAGWKQDMEKQMQAIVAEQDAAKLKTLVAAFQNQAHEWFQDAEKSRGIEDQAVQRLAHRLRNWAEYGRVISEGFRGSRSMEAIEVGAAAKMSVERWRPHAEKKNLQIGIQTADNLLVWGERSLVEQVIENLIDNAIKATENGKVEVAARSDKGSIVVEVKDSGCGIPEKDLGTIFEKPFYQGHGRQSLEQSTGVGLYLVAQYVRSLGGRVRAESEVGKGSSFFVELPRYNQERQGAAA